MVESYLARVESGTAGKLFAQIDGYAKARRQVQRWLAIAKADLRVRATAQRTLATSTAIAEELTVRFKDLGW